MAVNHTKALAAATVGILSVVANRVLVENEDRALTLFEEAGIDAAKTFGALNTTSLIFLIGSVGVALYYAIGRDRIARGAQAVADIFVVRETKAESQIEYREKEEDEEDEVNSKVDSEHSR